ncbi:hypothetical protein ACFFJT_21060 [Dyella flava]|uniref:Fap n=1 Tax=Dyella flava TaxID=1920170 RepID=A0ABS2JXY6_9GAMM|nr:hypothetical protein [Dyella flava]MBM7123842.1 hypothetical protein [Dyella flava]GLQ52662.1 hypothetical protein GCM10010872_41110 [Dyella flava]
MDSTRQRIHNQVCRCASVAIISAMGLSPTISFADGAHVAQKAGPGDIVLIRNVAARPADRNPTAPGMALMVNASPNPQLNSAINGNGSSGEMTDTEIADLTANVSSGNGGSGQNSVQRSLNSALGINTGGNNAGGNTASNGVSNLVSGPAGAAGSITDSTRSLGDQVTNAVSQIPMIGGH